MKEIGQKVQIWGKKTQKWELGTSEQGKLAVIYTAPYSILPVIRKGVGSRQLGTVLI
jgi:hypothetical protein